MSESELLHKHRTHLEEDIKPLVDKLDEYSKKYGTSLFVHYSADNNDNNDDTDTLALSIGCNLKRKDIVGILSTLINASNILPSELLMMVVLATLNTKINIVENYGKETKPG